MKDMSKMTRHATSCLPGPALKTICLCGLAVILAACKHGDDGARVAGWSLVDPSEAHPILVSQKPSTLSLEVSRGSYGLSPAQRADVLDFATRYRVSDTGNSRLVIAAPSGTSNEVSAMQAVHQIRTILTELGFGDAAISVEPYQASKGHAPVRISYMRYVAEAPECGIWPTNLANDPGNTPYANFGCATQRNFAMQVANPADLLGPRTMTDRLSERRDAVYGKYIRGETTGSQKTNDERIRTTKSGGE
ncbi:MAG: CpaD family pilus assembly protein [Hyphomicrobiaceae bacterium]|nr:CpaD family pilus assembly protein [Hyphomicrobiaceae bacterium]